MSLFNNELPEWWELKRVDDPETSGQSARHMKDSGKLGSMMALALDLLRNNPGRTAAELESLYGKENGCIRKRLNDLRRKGYAEKGEARKCSVTGRNAQTWRAD